VGGYEPLRVHPAATPGGHIDSQQFDGHGNEVWSLESTNRALALGLLPDADAKAAELLHKAVPVVQYWLDQWSDLAESALAGPVTIVLDTSANEDPGSPGEVVVHIDVAEVADADSARSVVLAAALRGAADLQDSTVVNGFGQWVIGRPQR
jgi:hypothetical protein